MVAVDRAVIAWPTLWGCRGHCPYRETLIGLEWIAGIFALILDRSPRKLTVARLLEVFESKQSQCSPCLSVGAKQLDSGQLPYEFYAFVRDFLRWTDSLYSNAPTLHGLTASNTCP
jgi:hypothetical protein